jgi:hypothetical protein
MNQMDGREWIRGTGPPRITVEAQDAGPVTITLSVRNLSTVVERKQLGAPFKAFIKQVNNDLHLYWNNLEGEEGNSFIPFVARIAEVRARKPWPENTGDEIFWRATILDYPGQALSVDGLRHMPLEALNAVGYHYYDQDDGVPQMVVCAALAQQIGVPWTLTFSHELLEALTDPMTRSSIDRGGRDYEVEICDPVQYHGYPIDGVWVSNFVTPAWFKVDRALGTGWNTRAVVRAAAGGPDVEPPGGEDREPGNAHAEIPYDFANLLSAPRQRALGGTRTRRVNGSDVTEELNRTGSVVTTLP